MAAGAKTSRVQVARRTLPLLLGSLGVFGLGVGAATQLGMVAGSTVQAGSTSVGVSCQPADQLVEVTLGRPEFVGGSGSPWAVTEVRFSGIAPGCVGHFFEAAYREDAEWLPAGAGTIEGTTVTVPLSGAAQDAEEFALTITR